MKNRHLQYLIIWLTKHYIIVYTRSYFIQFGNISIDLKSMLETVYMRFQEHKG